MNKKKRFNISSTLKNGFEETISIVENDDKIYRNSVIPISRIVRDPNNPRTIYLTQDDIKNGLGRHDKNYARKELELSKILELAESIKESGLIQPIVVYKQMDKYCIIAGERRFLASVAANKAEIEARIFQNQPSDLELKLIQWFENNEREDLTLFERICNLKSICESLPLYEKEKKVSVTKLHETTKLSKAQASAYAAIINGHEDVMHAIQLNKISNLDKAVLINSIADNDLRSMAIKFCKEGISLNRLRQYIASNNSNKISRLPAKQTASKKGVNLGYIQNPLIIQKIVNIVMASPLYENIADNFKQINWQDNKSAKNAFTKLVKILESSK